jgi:processive 1,2-diacylglycerol beta-glucosyltransferase
VARLNVGQWVPPKVLGRTVYSHATMAIRFPPEAHCDMARVLILYIAQGSGHHAAARYLEAAFSKQAPGVRTLCVDLLKHTHPKWEKIIHRMYMTTIRRTPELWEALYDNFWVEHLTCRLRQMVQRGNSESLRRLMSDFCPDSVICTQAYPLAVISSFAARQASNLPLFAVTTDFVPHRFWITNNGCNVQYVVPTDSAAARLMWLGEDQNRIHVLGLPVSVDYLSPPHTPLRWRSQRRILVMGGGRGMGIRYQTVRRLDLCPDAFTIDVVCGTNQRLRRRLLRNRHKFRHSVRARGYVRNTVKRMSRADLMISKAGGMTLAEATCLGIPLLLVRPLPGQERRNTEVMVHHGAALHVRNEYDITRSVTTLLRNRELLQMMRDKALAIARPDAATQIVRHVLDLISNAKPA